MDKKFLSKLSKTVSHILRHEPWLYELELNDLGWISIELLVSALCKDNDEWGNITEKELTEMIANSDKKRHEIHKGKIRALYGHSLPQKLIMSPVEPPKILYHGTTPDVLEAIKSQGLKPMSRQYVHLSANIEIAKQVGQRKAKYPVILMVNAFEAYQFGLRFYSGNDYVFLADFVSPEFIDF